MRQDLLKLAESLIDPKAPPLKLPNPGLIAAWGKPKFPNLPEMKRLNLDDILFGHGETAESEDPGRHD
jgi:hypothetical protein